MKTKVNNNIKLKSGGGLINEATHGLSVDGAYSLPVYENLTEGDLVKSLNDNGTFKAAKIIGVKNPITQSVNSSGNIVKAKWLSTTQIVILTSSKLYLANFDGTTMGALVDITPAGGSSDFDIIDTTHIISARHTTAGSLKTLYAVAIDVSSGSASFGGEVSKVVANYSGGDDIVVHGIVVNSATSYTLTGRGQVGNGSMGAVALSGTISGKHLTIGNHVVLSQSSYFYNLGKLKKINNTHCGTLFVEHSSLYFSLIKVNGDTTTFNNYPVDGSISNPASRLDFVYYNNKVYCLYVLSGGVLRTAVGTISGDTATMGSSSEFFTNYAFTKLINYNEIMYLLVGNTIYSFVLTTLIEPQILEQKTIPTLAIITENVSSDFSFFALSYDAAIKTVKFMLDACNFIGIADKNYTVSDNFLINDKFKKTGIINGATYYVGTDGQSLTTINANNKKIGKAISNNLIVKE